ncbi:MAG: hypothetical protein LUH55_00750 [Bacteroides thetaiotaomicron]|nr:hypothetical protein [Bacteroides thetaiotaomicron]
MNRSQRRRLQKQHSARKIEKIIKDDIMQQVADQRVEAMMLSFTLALHEEYGFGKERCMRALQRVDSYMDTWLQDEGSLKRLAEKVENEIGIKVEL